MLGRVGAICHAVCQCFLSLFIFAFNRVATAFRIRVTVGCHLVVIVVVDFFVHVGVFPHGAGEFCPHACLHFVSKLFDCPRLQGRLEDCEHLAVRR